MKKLTVKSNIDDYTKADLIQLAKKSNLHCISKYNKDQLFDALIKHNKSTSKVSKKSMGNPIKSTIHEDIELVKKKPTAKSNIDDYTKADLVQWARKLDLSGISKYNKDQLFDALINHKKSTPKSSKKSIQSPIKSTVQEDTITKKPTAKSNIDDYTKADLVQWARKLDLSGISKYNKDQLFEALINHKKSTPKSSKKSIQTPNKSNIHEDIDMIKKKPTAKSNIEDYTKADLVQWARKLDLSGISKYNKDQLFEALINHKKSTPKSSKKSTQSPIKSTIQEDMTVSMEKPTAESDIDYYTKADLMQWARKLNLSGISKYNKDQLFDALINTESIDEELDEEYDDLNKNELKQMLERLGLKTSGKKADLIDRLEKFDRDEIEKSGHYMESMLPIECNRVLLYKNGLDITGSKMDMFFRLSDHYGKEDFDEMSVEESGKPTHGKKEELSDSYPELELDEKSCEDLKKMSHSLGCGISGSKKKLICNITKVLNNPNSLKGYIYILQSSVSNVIKIGQTKIRNDVNEVKKQLYRRYRTALGPNIKFHLFTSSKRTSDERLIHDLLASYRLSNTELFDIEFDKAVTIAKKVTNGSMITM